MSICLFSVFVSNTPLHNLSVLSSQLTTLRLKEEALSYFFNFYHTGIIFIITTVVTVMSLECVICIMVRYTWRGLGDIRCTAAGYNYVDFRLSLPLQSNGKILNGTNQWLPIPSQSKTIGRLSVYLSARTRRNIVRYWWSVRETLHNSC